jgi:hypothetical protein
MAGMPPRFLQMAIHGFVLEEGTKPAHERHLQVFLHTNLFPCRLSGPDNCYNT